MFHLQPGVHLDKKDLARRVNDKFDGAGPHIVDRARGGERGLEQDCALRLRQQHGGRFFDDLLMASLQRTITLEEVHDIAVRVPEDLNFDMARILDIAFKQHCGIAERGLGLALCRG